MNEKYSASLRLKVLEKIIEDIGKDGLRVGITQDNKLFVQNTVAEPTTEYGYAQSKSSFEVYGDILFNVNQIVYHPTYYTSYTNLSSITTIESNIKVTPYKISNIYENEYMAWSFDKKDSILFKSTDIGKSIFLSEEEAKKACKISYIPGLF